MEADGLRGMVFDTELYSQLTDRLGKCLVRLGLERIARPVTGAAEHTQLADYFSRPLAEDMEGADAAE
jgi:hypothetical protein